MGQLNMMAHNHHNGSLRISPQNIPPPPHLPPSVIPVSTAQSSSSIVPMNNIQQSPSQNLILRSPSPEKKATDINIDNPDDITNKDQTVVAMSISPENQSSSANTDIRTSSIASLRIKAKEHLENINKNLTMV